MSKPLRDVMSELAGKPVSDASIQRILAVAAAMGIRTDDPMMTMLVVLEHYNDLYKSAPKQIADACDKAASTASIQTKGLIQKAVAELIPSIRETVNDSVRSTRTGVQLASSMITIWVGCAVIGIVFCLGLWTGSSVLYSFNNNKITLTQFWQGLAASTGAGLLAPPLIGAAIYFWKSEQEWFSYICFFVGGILGLMALYGVQFR